MNLHDLVACYYHGENISPFEERLAALSLGAVAGMVEDEVNFINTNAVAEVIEHSALNIELMVVAFVENELKVLAPGRRVYEATVEHEVCLDHFVNSLDVPVADMENTPTERMIYTALLDAATSKLSFIPTQTNPDLPFEPIPLNISQIVGCGNITVVGAYVDPLEPYAGTKIVAMLEVPRAVVEGHAKAYFRHSDEPCELLSFNEIKYDVDAHNGLTRLVEYFNSDQVDEPVEDVGDWWEIYQDRH